MNADPLGLAALFAGGAERWHALLAPQIERDAEAATFLGPGRAASIVPVRELTFQALKPRPPERWKVVVFGQSPYPRLESATGIAMFDNSFRDWADARFGKVTSIRCILKAAAMWKLGVPKTTSTAELRRLLAEHRVVDPPAWFQAMLSQGVLLLNASLTSSTDDAIPTARHAKFWKPVIERIVEAILSEKAKSADPRDRSVVFAWWGTHAKALRGVVERHATRYPNVRVVHLDHCNPAAMGDAFCDGDPFGDVHRALTELAAEPIDWLPSLGWDAAHADASRMGEFIQSTMELHQQYLERLQNVGDEKDTELPRITGILASPRLPFEQAVAPLVARHANVAHPVTQALAFARKTRAAPPPSLADLDEHEIAALYLYTTESALYRALNAALREPARASVAAYAPYLRLFLSGLSKLAAQPAKLYRGVALDLRAQYREGRTIVWWGVSSCTSNPRIAHGFLGARGPRMLFEIAPRSAVAIKACSAFQVEDEYVLPPGTQLRVARVVHEPSGLSTVHLEELASERLVS